MSKTLLTLFASLIIAGLATAALAKWVYLPKTPEFQKNILINVTNANLNPISCAKEGERINHNPLLSPTDQKCCPDLIENRINESYSICKKPEPNRGCGCGQ